MIGDSHVNRQKNDKKSYIMLVSALTIMGTVGILRRYIPISSALLVFFRGLIGALSILLFTWIFRKKDIKKISRRAFMTLALGGIFLGINWLLLFEAYNYTTIAKATLCYYLAPTIVLLLSPIIFKERLKQKKLIAAAVSIIGMFFVSGMMESGGRQPDDIKGILLGLAAALFYALLVITNKKECESDAYTKCTVELFSAAIVLIPYLLMTENLDTLGINLQTTVLILVAGIIYTGVAYVLYFGSMPGLRAQTISSLSYIDPVVALVLPTILFKEQLSLWGVFGAILILGSAIIGES